MNYQKKKKLNVPENLEKFLIEFTVEILVNNPTDLNEFGYIYFTNIYQKKMNANVNITNEQAIESNCSKKQEDYGKRICLFLCAK